MGCQSYPALEQTAIWTQSADSLQGLEKGMKCALLSPVTTHSPDASSNDLSAPKQPPAPHGKGDQGRDFTVGPPGKYRSCFGANGFCLHLSTPMIPTILSSSPTHQSPLDETRPSEPIHITAWDTSSLPSLFQKCIIFSSA